MYPRFEPRRVFFAGCRCTAIGNLLLVQNAAQELRCSRD